MKILLVSNKTYRGFLDGSWWNLYLPLKDMGHEVYFYDTVEPLEKDFKAVVEKFKPEIIFCCLTGNRGIAPRWIFKCHIGSMAHQYRFVPSFKI